MHITDGTQSTPLKCIKLNHLMRREGVSAIAISYMYYSSVPAHPVLLKVPSIKYINRVTVTHSSTYTCSHDVLVSWIRMYPQTYLELDSQYDLIQLHGLYLHPFTENVFYIEYNHHEWEADMMALAKQRLKSLSVCDALICSILKYYFIDPMPADVYVVQSRIISPGTERIVCEYKYCIPAKTRARTTDQSIIIFNGSSVSLNIASTHNVLFYFWREDTRSIVTGVLDKICIYEHSVGDAANKTTYDETSCLINSRYYPQQLMNGVMHIRYDGLRLEIFPHQKPYAMTLYVFA